jgi:acid phosphatase (class A)
MKFLRLISTAVVLAMFSVAPPLRALDDTMSQPSHAAKAVEFSFLATGQIHAADILPPPPGTEAERTAAMETVRSVFHNASEADKNAAYAEKKFSVFNFTEAAGNFLVETNLPKTTAFFEKVQKDAEAVTDEGKDFFHEPRPYSTEATTLALVLAELLPEKRDAILAHADLMGWHRVQIARHYPADIYAGRELARAIVRELKKSESFQKEFAEAKAELDAAHAAAKN